MTLEGRADEPWPEEESREEEREEQGAAESEDKELAAQKRSALIFALTFPLFFIVMFPLAYVTALHQPVIHDFPVGVVGTQQEAQAEIQKLGDGTGDMFEFSTVASREDARQEIFAQEIKAAYVPGEEPALLIAGADGRLATQFVPQAFQGVAQSEGGGLSVEDVAPLASGDVTGIGLMFYMLIPVLVGFISANILGMAAGWFLSLRVRVGLSAILAILAAVVPWAFMGPWLQIIQGSAAQISGILALAAVVSFTVGLIATSLVELMGKWAIFVLITTFVFINIPSSGATFPAEAVPSLFTFISEFHIGAAFVEGLRSILYFGGEGVWHAAGVIGGWLFLGLVLLVTAIVKKRHDEQKAAESGEVKETGAAASASA